MLCRIGSRWSRGRVVTVQREEGREVMCMASKQGVGEPTHIHTEHVMTISALYKMTQLVLHWVAFVFFIFLLKWFNCWPKAPLKIFKSFSPRAHLRVWVNICECRRCVRARRWVAGESEGQQHPHLRTRALQSQDQSLFADINTAPSPRPPKCAA